MARLTRRSVLRSSLGLAAASSLARPYIANAAATTATVWWTQGFAEEEDIAFKKIVADYEKASGNTIDYSIIPYAPQRQKIISASQAARSRICSATTRDQSLRCSPGTISWSTSSDVVETQKEEYTETALLTAHCYNSVEKRRSFYGVPYTVDVFTNHIWRSLVEKAGYKMEDIPKTWDAFYDFFKGVQKKLREQGMRNVYGLGFQVTTNGGDPWAFFYQFLIAYGGRNIVTKDGKLHPDDPQVREAVIKALTYPTTAYKEGYVPPSAINWNDADDNNAFHSKLTVMDLDGSLSTEVAIIKDKQDYDDIVTMGLALSNDGKPVPSGAGSFCALDPEGSEERSGGQGLPQIFDPAECAQRISEDRARRRETAHAVDRKEGSVVARSQRPASGGLHHAGRAEPNLTASLGLQSSLCASRERACLAEGLGRDHQGRDGA